MTEAVRILPVSLPDGVTAGQGSRALGQGLVAWLVAWAG
jgi:hypothetical protein